MEPTWTITSTHNHLSLVQIQQRLDFMHKLEDVRWQVQWTRRWPFFWLWKRVYVVTFTLRSETKEQQHERFVSGHDATQVGSLFVAIAKLQSLCDKYHPPHQECKGYIYPGDIRDIIKEFTSGKQSGSGSKDVDHKQLSP